MKPNNNEWRSTQPEDTPTRDFVTVLTEIMAGVIIFTTTARLAYWFFSTWAGKAVATNFPIG